MDKSFNYSFSAEILHVFKEFNEQLIIPVCRVAECYWRKKWLNIVVVVVFCFGVDKGINKNKLYALKFFNWILFSPDTQGIFSIETSKSCSLKFFSRKYWINSRNVE